MEQIIDFYSAKLIKKGLQSDWNQLILIVKTFALTYSSAETLSANKVEELGQIMER